MTETEHTLTKIAETEAGRLFRPEGKPYMFGGLLDSSWRGRPPVADHCTKIPDFEAQQYPNEGPVFNLPGTPKPARQPLQMTTENLINACDNHARNESDPHSFDFAVTFRVLLGGEYRGTWYGNRFGWRWTS